LAPDGIQETGQNSEKQFKGRLFPAQRRQFKLEFRSLASLTIWLDQEEELAQLVSDGIQGTTSAKQKPLKKLIQVNFLCCQRNCFK
jgi:hypothetical protein